MNTALKIQDNNEIQSPIVPQSFQEMMQLADLISRSSMCPKQFRGDAGSCFVVMNAGRKFNMDPFAALNAFCNINGKPSLYGDAPLAICQGSGLVESIEETFDESTMTATCKIKRKGDPILHTETFSKEDAKKAGLWGKSGPWTQYTTRMLKLRARGFALRDRFPDVLLGTFIAEEQRDIADYQKPIKIEPKYNPGQPLPKPKMTVKEIMERSSPKEPEAVVETKPEPPKAEDKRTLFDHHQFESIREYWDSDPDRLMIMTKKRNLDEISEIPIKFFDVIITAMEKKD